MEGAHGDVRCHPVGRPYVSKGNHNCACTDGYDDVVQLRMRSGWCLEGLMVEAVQHHQVSHLVLKSLQREEWRKKKQGRKLKGFLCVATVHHVRKVVLVPCRKSHVVQGQKDLCRGGTDPRWRWLRQACKNHEEGIQGYVASQGESTGEESEVCSRRCGFVTPAFHMAFDPLKRENLSKVGETHIVAEVVEQVARKNMG